MTEQGLTESQRGPSREEIDHLGALFNQGRYPDMEMAAQGLTLRFPTHALGWKALGTALLQQGRRGEALAPLLKAVELEPNDAETHNNLGNLLKDQCHLHEAEAGLRRALEIKPDYAEAYNNLGNVLKAQSRLPEAEALYRRALMLKPDYAEAHGNLAAICHDEGRLLEAEACYREALAIKPGDAQMQSNLGVVLKDQGRLIEAGVQFRRALEIVPDLMDTHSNLLFTLSYTAGHVLSYCLEEARRYGLAVSQRVGERFSCWSCAPAPNRLRVGLVSGDLINHPVGFFIESLLKNLAPARVELVAYPTHPNEDALTARIKPCFAAWKPLHGLSDEAAARLIHADGVHVLLDLSGHTAHNRLPVFAWKPAPVQASWLGYFATTGMAEMDYFLADEVGVPEVERGNFTETVWYLPDTRLCFSAPKVGLPVVSLPALKNGHLTFGCFQNLTKVGEGVLAAWARILAALPNARLRWQCRQLGDLAVVEQLVERLQQHGIDPARVALLGSVSREAYLAAHAEVDLILDTFPYPGGTTTCEALWMGVPTLTLAGDRLLARQGAGLLTAAGLAEWIAVSEADYVQKAISLAADAPKLAALRQGLRAHVLASPLFDAPRFARNFEAALWGMWQGLKSPSV